jgi:hypothetical protein
MNERIRKLADEATRKYDRLGNDIPFAQPDLEKFAELIVRESADVLLKWKGEPFPFDEDLAASLIKQHFGVEE